MNKIFSFSIAVLAILFLSGCTSSQGGESGGFSIGGSKNNFVPTEEAFLQILSTNKDGSDYLNVYPNTRVVNYTLVKPSEFETYRENTEYKRLYEDLPQKDLYYVEFNGGTALTLITMIDPQTESVVKIYGVYIMGMG